MAARPLACQPHNNIPNADACAGAVARGGWSVCSLARLLDRLVLVGLLVCLFVR
jgi:hypothetical protein